MARIDASGGQRHRPRAVGALLVALALLTWAVPPARAAERVERTVDTASFRLTLGIGPAEAMLTPDQAAAQHATSGEVMAAMPGMAMPGGMAMGNRHVEVRVVARATGAVVKDAAVAITLADADGRVVRVEPVVAMYGAAAGPADWHYGNNAEVPDGTYRVEVSANGEAAMFADVMVGGAGAAPAAGAGATVGQMPMRMPDTGAGGAGRLAWPAWLGLAATATATAVGAAWSRRGRPARHPGPRR